MPKNTLVINCDIRETRVALIEGGVIAELQIERANARGTVGNIVLGRVTRVLPGMQAAFIDVGMERAAFLHVEDLIRPNDLDAYLAGARRTEDADRWEKGDGGRRRIQVAVAEDLEDEDDDDDEEVVNGAVAAELEHDEDDEDDDEDEEPASVAPALENDDEDDEDASEASDEEEEEEEEEVEEHEVDSAEKTLPKRCPKTRPKSSRAAQNRRPRPRGESADDAGDAGARTTQRPTKHR